MVKKRKRGRPPGRTYTEGLMLWLSPEQHAALTAAAKGRLLSRYARETLMEAIRAKRRAQRSTPNS